MTGESTSVAAARRLVAAAQHIVVLSGAGISTDSGIPDFRGPQGVWTKNPAAEKASDIHHWVSDAALRRTVWQARVDARDAPAPRPNAGHRALVDLEHTGRVDLVVTQNIDGLHREAGTSPSLLVEIHGTSRQAVCLACGTRLAMPDVLARVEAGEDDPTCQMCGGMLKSATISFGQGLVEADLDRALHAAQTCDLLFAVGSTLSVYPIAGMVPLAARAGAHIVIANGEATDFDGIADVVVRGALSDVLPQIVH